MKTYHQQITKSKTAIIVELEENEIIELEKGNPITVEIKTTFYNQALLNRDMEKFWEEVEMEHNQEKYDELTKEIAEVRKKLNL